MVPRGIMGMEELPGAGRNGEPPRYLIVPFWPEIAFSSNGTGDQLLVPLLLTCMEFEILRNVALDVAMILESACISLVRQLSQQKIWISVNIMFVTCLLLALAQPL